jgi:fatty acid desaturase
VPAPAPTAGDLLTLSELRALRGISGLRGAGLVLHAWGVIAGTMALYIVWPTWLTLAAGVAIIGGRQLGLSVLMHEAALWLLFKGQKANVRAGGWLCAWPLGADLKFYRRRHHLEHHLLVFVPCWRLREAHTLLLAKGLGARMELAASYAGVAPKAVTS